MTFMENKVASLIVPIHSPWNDVLLEAIKQVQSKLFFACPYIKSEIMSMVKETLFSRNHTSVSLEIQVITRALPEEFLNGSSDITALQQILEWSNEMPGSTVEVRVINNVHAKVWICDTRLALVGSGNATPSGLFSNLEYGLAVSDPQLVKQIWDDWQQWWREAAVVTEDQLEEMRLWLNKIKSDKELYQIEMEAEKKRKLVEHQVGAAPRIGRPLPMAIRSKTTILPLPKEDNTESKHVQQISSLAPYSLRGNYAEPDQSLGLADELIIDDTTISLTTVSMSNANTQSRLANDPPWDKVIDISIPPEAIYQALWYHSSNVHDLGGGLVSYGGLLFSVVGKAHKDVKRLATVPSGTTGLFGPHLWQALLATVPIVDIVRIDEDPNHIFPLHGLLTIENIQQKGKRLLQCTWSDKNRTSQVTIATSRSASQPSWIIALNTQDALKLMKRLNAALRDSWGTTSLKDHKIHLSFQESSSELELFYTLNALLVGAAQNFERLVIGSIKFPCQQVKKANTLATSGDPYICLIVKHKSLLEAMKHLKNSSDLVGLSPPEVEVYIDPFENQLHWKLVSYLSGTPITYSMPIDQLTPIDASIKLRFDYATLANIIFYSSHEIYSWQISVGANVEKMQLTPVTWAKGTPLSKLQHEIEIALG